MSAATRPEAAALPSGRQVEIAHGSQRAAITEVGACLRAYDVGDWPVVDGYAASEMASGGRGQVLLPWPNRIGDGRYRFQGADYQLPLSEPGRHNASHGLVRWSNWVLEQAGPAAAIARYDLHPQPGYPFNLHFDIEYQLSDEGLRTQVAATNVGTAPAPFGAGAHPYLSVGTGLVDGAVLRVPAGSYVPTDERGLPTGAPVQVAGTDFDFRQSRPIGGTSLDVCYADVERDAAGTVRVTFADGSGTREVTVWGDSTVRYLMVFTGDTLAPDRRRRSLAIEPMTCPPDAFRSGTAVITIEPGEEVTTSWGVTPRPLPPV